MTEPTETVRLHITPFTSDLLPAVLPPSIRSTATDISFHTIATFPENNYGYVTLPKMDAEKIKKKLNGSILKGKKFKIDTARPHKRQLDEEAEPEPTKEKKKSKKSKSTDDKDTLEGYELPSDRKVKRGWTEPGSKKDKRKSDKSKSKDDKKEKPQPKSKYTEKAECLFRTNLPPNKAAEAEEDKKAKKKKTKSSETVVHEFAKTYTQPSFLRSKDDGATPTATFDEEKGWMDKSGNVKETTSEKARKKDYRPGKVAGAKEKRPVMKKSASKAKPEEPQSSAESEDWTSSSGSSDESSDSDSDSESEDESEKEDSSSEDSDSDSDSSKEDHATEKPNQQKTDSADTTSAADESDEDMSEAAEKPETEEPVQDDNQNESKEVHPLEALFKRPAAEATETQPTQPAETGFSFFGNNDDIESDEESRIPEPQTPFTPFTKRDIQDRGLRSAAPTPDTAVANRHMTWNEMEDMDDDDEEISIDTPVSKPREGDKEETEFAKWFWENRGDNNRAWKKRRRDAAKEQRQRENRKKGMKGKS